MTGHVFAMAMAALDEVNGPEGQPRSQDARAEWDKIDWRAHEERGRRPQRREFQEGRGAEWAQGREPAEASAAEPDESTVVARGGAAGRSRGGSRGPTAASRRWRAGCRPRGWPRPTRCPARSRVVDYGGRPWHALV